MSVELATQAISMPGDLGIPESANRRFREEQARLKELKKQRRKSKDSHAAEGSKKPKKRRWPFRRKPKGK